MVVSMSRHTLTLWAMMIVAIFFFVTSYLHSDWSYFSRSGALIVAISVFMEYWPILKEPQHDNMPMWRAADSHSAARVLAICIIIGTLIWGYGDLFCLLFNQCA